MQKPQNRGKIKIIYSYIEYKNEPGSFLLIKNYKGDDTMTPEKIIKQYRINAGLKAVEVAAQLKMSKQQYNHIEKTDSVPEEHIINLAKTLNANYEILKNQLYPDRVEGSTVAYYRKLNKITQKELAEKLGVNQHYVSLIEKNKVKPSKYYQTLRELLNIPDKKIYPSIVAWNSSFIILEFEELLMVITYGIEEKSISFFRHYITTNVKKVLMCQTESEILPLLPDQDGVIPEYPVVISNTAELIVIELNNQLIIVSQTMIEMKAIREITDKHIIISMNYGIYDARPTAATITEEFEGRTLLLSDLNKRLEQYFPTLQLVEKNNEALHYNYNDLNLFFEIESLSSNIIFIKKIL